MGELWVKNVGMDTRRLHGYGTHSLHSFDLLIQSVQRTRNDLPQFGENGGLCWFSDVRLEGCFRSAHWQHRIVKGLGQYMRTGLEEWD